MKIRFGTVVTLLVMSALAVSAFSSMALGQVNEAGAKMMQDNQAVQPEYAKWQRIQKGMTREEVQKILGPPITRLGEELRRGYAASWTYGSVVMRSLAFPHPLSFRISIQDGKVDGKEDPFDGVFSTDGRPTRPRLISPNSEQRFNHYPRLLDFRWYPASGIYPMRYIIEVDSKVREEYGGQWIPADPRGPYKSDIPYLSISFVGSQPGRWRVKAVNELGESPWSEYRHFEFTR